MSRPPREPRPRSTDAARAAGPSAHPVPAGTFDDAAQHEAVEERLRESEARLRESEERFHTFFEQAAVGLAYVALDGRYLRVNQRYCEITGHSRESMLRRTWQELTHPDDLPADLAYRAGVIAGEPPGAAREKRYLRADGSIVWVDLTVSLVSSPPDGSAYLIAAAQDITPRKNAERVIHGQLAEIEAIYQRAPIGLAVLDQELRFRRINERLAEMNGIAAADHLGRTVREVIPAVAEAAEARLREVLGSGAPVLGIEISGETPARPGVTRTWVESWVPILDEHGARTGISVVAEEVTDQRRTEQLRETFISMLSHELRTPITTLMAAAELLRDRVHGTESDLAREVADGAMRLHRMVENLLVLARVERGAELLAPEPVLLQRVLPRIISQERRLWPDHRFRLRVPVDLPPVRSDPDALGQVLINLVSNSIKYGGTPGEIEIVAKVHKPDVLLIVSDRGPGFQDADPSQLFELFYRAPAATRRAAGSGVGLFACQALVHAMGGRISARDRPRGGAQFEVALPILESD